jgi:hypothetical protein
MTSGMWQISEVLFLISMPLYFYLILWHERP